MKRLMEILVGLFVLGGVAALFYLAIAVSNVGAGRDGSTYELVAYFDNIGGLKPRSPVTLSGVRVGRVTSIEYDPERFAARVTMAIQSRYDELPADTAAMILTSGLLGEQYIGLEPGGDTEVLRDGDELLITQSAVVLENLIGRFLSSMGSP